MSEVRIEVAHGDALYTVTKRASEARAWGGSATIAGGPSLGSLIREAAEAMGRALKVDPFRRTFRYATAPVTLDGRSIGYRAVTVTTDLDGRIEVEIERAG